ncbi:MAG: winged helix-turn-helix domain-containing protein [Candidatus Velthaea sp.]
MSVHTSDVWIKLRFSDDRALGPGKIKLLEVIEQTGSISAASRKLGMSYPRAWKLVDELNALFRKPVVVTRIGGAIRGGAQVTDLGHDVVRRYRAIEARTTAISARHLTALEGVLAK